MALLLQRLEVDLMQQWDEEACVIFNTMLWKNINRDGLRIGKMFPMKDCFFKEETVPRRGYFLGKEMIPCERLFPWEEMVLGDKLLP